MTEDELIAKWIEPNPNKPRAEEAVVRDYFISVWAIIGYYDAYHGDIGRVAQAYAIPREPVEAAVAYYRRHKCAIDNRIEANAS
jgi:uncharacterized protein (DUF433 family)